MKLRRTFLSILSLGLIRGQAPSSPICPVCKSSMASSINYYINVNGSGSNITFKGSYIGKPAKVCPTCGVISIPK